MSTLKADTIQNTSGGAATLTKQEVPKARLMYDQANTNIDGSFNISSVDDAAAGRHSANFTSNLSLGFATTASSSDTSSGQNDTSVRGGGNSVTTQVTTGYQVLTYKTTTATDMELDASVSVGDLV
jgi:hypothetical protein